MSRDVRFLVAQHPLIPGHLRDLGNYFHRGCCAPQVEDTSVTTAVPQSRLQSCPHPLHQSRQSLLQILLQYAVQLATGRLGRYPIDKFVSYQSRISRSPYSRLVSYDVFFSTFHRMFLASLNNIHILSLRLIKRPPVNLVGRQGGRRSEALEKANEV